MQTRFLSSEHVQFIAIVSRYTYQWLCLCTLLPLLIPGSGALWQRYGALWLWMIILPICTLFILHRHRWATAWSTILVRRSRRRLGHYPTNTQARRVGFGHRLSKQSPSRAA